MILPLIILYVVTLVYLAITERFRNFASLIGLQGWLLFAVALVRLHAINPASSRDCFSPSSAARRSTASRAPAPRSPARCCCRSWRWP